MTYVLLVVAVSALWSVWNTVCQKKIRTCRKFLHDLCYVSIDEMQTVVCLELFTAARRHAPSPKGQWKVPLGKVGTFLLWARGERPARFSLILCCPWPNPIGEGSPEGEEECKRWKNG